jgi:phage internal scaffolding protein
VKGDVVMVKIHSLYDVPVSPGVTFKDVSLAQQHFAVDADINNIMHSYQQTGILGDPLAVVKPSFGDFSSEFDYQVAYNQILEAQEMFAELPSDLRRRFGDDPGQLLHFLADPGNREEAVKLGLVANSDVSLSQSLEKPPEVPPEKPPEKPPGLA